MQSVGASKLEEPKPKKWVSRCLVLRQWGNRRISSFSGHGLLAILSGMGSSTNLVLDMPSAMIREVKWAITRSNHLYAIVDSGTVIQVDDEVQGG